MKRTHSLPPVTTIITEDENINSTEEEEINISLLQEAIGIIREKYVDQNKIDRKKNGIWDCTRTCLVIR